MEGLPAGEVKGVPVSVSLELSRWLLSREMRLELPPLELRFSSAMLCEEQHVTQDEGQSKNKTASAGVVVAVAGQSHPLLPLNQLRRKVLVELLLLHVSGFDLHAVLQHVDVVGLSVHCNVTTRLVNFLSHCR